MVCNFTSVTQSWHDRRLTSFGHTLALKMNRNHEQLTSEAMHI